MKFQVGDKVVPVAKTVKGYEGLESSIWSGKGEDQGFLYIVGYDGDYKCYICNNVFSENDGDFFNECDLVPYVQEFYCTCEEGFDGDFEEEDYEEYIEDLKEEINELNSFIKYQNQVIEELNKSNIDKDKEITMLKTILKRYL